MKKNGIWCFVVVAFLATPGHFASAQSANTTAFQLQQFRPWGDPYGLFHGQSPKTLKQWSYTVGLQLNYAKDPLTLRDPDNKVVDNGYLLRHQLGADLSFGLGLTSWLDLYLVLPMTLYQSGALPDLAIFGNQRNQELSGFYFGDLKMALKFGFLKQEKHAINLGLQVYMSFPTASAGRLIGFNGEDSVGGGATLLFGRGFGDFLDLNLHFGYHYTPKTEITITSNPDNNLVVEHALSYSLGVNIHTIAMLDVIVELMGRAYLNNAFLDSTSLEGLFGIRLYPIPDEKSLALNLGFGLPFYAGIGSPQFRIFAGLIWSPRNEDKDKDGIKDKQDKCPAQFGPKENQGCPWGDKDGDGLTDNIDRCPAKTGPKANKGCPWGDKDKDGLTDNIDRCPAKAGPRANKGCPWGDKDKDGLTDNIDRCPAKFGPKENDGCPWGDQDRDTITDNIDKCPTQPGPRENKGCPDTDKDKDGVVDRLDKCPNVPGLKEKQGCPKVVLVKVTKDKIEILQKVFFALGSARIRKKSYPVLDQVVLVLKSNKALTIRVEGHTDDIGSARRNLRLSEKRANSVRDYMVKKGISALRLSAKGFGETKPLIKKVTKAARAKNRRVEFTIVTSP